MPIIEHRQNPRQRRASQRNHAVLRLKGILATLDSYPVREWLPENARAELTEARKRVALALEHAAQDTPHFSEFNKTVKE